MLRRFEVAILVSLLLLLAAVGCTQEKPSAKSEEPVGEKAIRVGYGSDIDPADVADHLGYDLLAPKYKVTVAAFNEDNSVVAGLIKGQLDIGNIGLPDAIKAIQMGVPLKVVMFSNMRHEFVLVAQPGIESVNDLKGKRVAFHAIGSGTEILPKVLVRRAGMKLEDVNWITLPESPNRAAAMLTKRIDATALEFADVLTLQEQGSFNVIGSFGEAFPEATSSCFIVTEMFAQSNKDIIGDFVAALIKGYEKAYADRSAWLVKCKELCPLVPDGRAGRTYEFYVSIKMFPKAPIVTQEGWDAMNKFYVETGEYEDPAPLDIVLTDLIREASSK